MPNFAEISWKIIRVFLDKNTNSVILHSVLALIQCMSLSNTWVSIVFR